jgi:hypothetical protein
VGVARFEPGLVLQIKIKEECLDRVIPLGEAHLRELVHEYVALASPKIRYQPLG